ncbi:hypothetical protein ASF00_01810 [Sphingomonas sp. Leaf34]|uniref:hypothetical protein n=1 Tax=Sphingomonas sp. Leaf34 TaxID=1736216 RepID=UPI0006FEE966|nr:hypothetical protein [Sphingomonas sp. Leaf34]KQN31564.1 hypothetical protein ASF00_01810 [Sphingomonas sp. Leaf34]
MTAPLAPLGASDAPPHATPTRPQTAAHPENAPPEIAPLHCYAPATPARYTQRSDGWTPDRQRGFLERIAEGATVDEASASVGLSPGAAYALRRRAAGAAFALGWDAARLVARPAVAETLFLRAIAGQTERVTRPDGEVIERHRYDNRLAMALLNRLDRHADATEAANAATRMVATEFDAFLDVIAGDASPARAGLFLGERLKTDATIESATEQGAAGAALAPILALARADRWLRTGAGLASEIAIADLDPAARAGWTAAQWARAEAVGLLRLAPDPEPPIAPPAVPPAGSAAPAPASALCELHSDLHEGRVGDSPVWYDPIGDGWRTSFPPPGDFDGDEGSDFGDDGYSRACSADEAIILDTPRDREIAARRVVEAADRDAWFLGYAVDAGLVDADRLPAIGDTDADRVAGLAWAFDSHRSGDLDALEDVPDIAAPRDAEPKPPTGRSPAATYPFDGDPP